jgi:hypothetical protein
MTFSASTAFEHAVYEPGRRGGAGDRGDQLGATMHRHRVHHPQQDTQRLQVHPVRGRRVGYPVGHRRDVLCPAAAAHPVPVMLTHDRRNLRNVMLLMRQGRTQISRAGQVRPTTARPHQVVRHGLVRVLTPRQVRSRRPPAACPAYASGPYPARPCQRAESGPAGHPSMAASTSCPSCAQAAAPAPQPARSTPRPARSTAQSSAPAMPPTRATPRATTNPDQTQHHCLQRTDLHQVHTPEGRECLRRGTGVRSRSPLARAPRDRRPQPRPRRCGGGGAAGQPGSPQQVVGGQSPRLRGRSCGDWSSIM